MFTKVKKYYPEYSILRVFTILLVIFVQHGFAPYLSSWHFVDAPKEVWYVYRFFVDLVSPWTMPLLMFVSGALFFTLKKNDGKYSSFISFIVNKIKRLLFPTILWGCVFSISFCEKIDVIRLFGGWNHLWFLPSLFWCFIVAFFLLKPMQLNKIILMVIILISILLTFVPFPKVLGLDAFCSLFFYFLLGVFYSINKLTIDVFLNKNKIMLSFTSVLLLFAYVVCCNDLFLNMTPDIPSIYLKILRRVLVPLIILTFCGLVCKFTASHKLPQWFLVLDKYSFGCYIFHMWLMWLVFKYNVCDIRAFAASHYIFFPLMYGTLSFVLSMGISFLLKSNKTTRNLI